MDGTAITTLAVNGDLEMSNAAKYLAQAQAMLEPGSTSVFVLDLAGVEFIDSQGVGFLIETRNLALHNGIDIRLRGVPPRVRKILDLTGLTAVFTLED